MRFSVRERKKERLLSFREREREREIDLFVLIRENIGGVEGFFIDRRIGLKMVTCERKRERADTPQLGFN